MWLASPAVRTFQEAVQNARRHVQPAGREGGNWSPPAPIPFWRAVWWAADSPAVRSPHRLAPGGVGGVREGFR